MFKKTLLAGAVAATLMPGVVPAADSPHTLTGNVGLYSQYIFRGLKQTNGDPAIQGGFDYSHSSGFYAGTWASNISWLKENFSIPGLTTGQYSGGGSMEWDFYGGYKGNIGKSDFTFDIGGLYYWYPGDVAAGCFIGAVSCPKADTFEVYGAIGWKWLSAKYSHSVNNKTFGLPDSGGTYYLDITATFPVTKELNLIAHWGQQKYDGHVTGLPINNDQLASYEDWKIGITYALPKDFTIGFFYTDVSGANNLYYGGVGDAPAGPYPKNIAKGTGTIFISKTF